MDQGRIKLLLRGAGTLVPATSLRPSKEPVTVDILHLLVSQLDPEDPFDVAFCFAMLAAFWCVARLGEFLTSQQTVFDPALHPSGSSITLVVDRTGHEVHNIHAPFTKSAGSAGEDMSFAAQDPPICAKAAYDRHLRINVPLAHEHLFSYTRINARTRVSQRLCLTRNAFLRRLNSAAKSANIPVSTGHGFCVGGTLEYLLRGVPFEVVKTLGRWKSNAFQLYLRKHAQILVPFLQERPEVHANFLHYTIATPPVR